MDAKFTVQTNDRLRHELEGAFDLDMGDMKRVAVPLDSHFRKSEIKIFASQGSAGGGGRWAALSPDYAKWKRRVKPGRKIMAFSGKTRKAFTRPKGDHVMTYRLKPRPAVTMGAAGDKEDSPGRIAAYHARPKGFRNPLYNKSMPDRDVMWQSGAMKRRYFAIVTDMLAEKLKRVARFKMKKRSVQAARRA